MSTLVRSLNPPISLDPESRTRLLERVSNSISFQRAPRLRELLEYLCHIGPTGAVSEHQIGIEVFKRPPDYNASVDTIARVQVSQLRKKLEQFFLTEGALEPVVIDFPRGSYVPVFRPATWQTVPPRRSTSSGLACFQPVTTWNWCWPTGI